MTAQTAGPTMKPPSYVVDTAGQPTGVILDIATWREILAELEDQLDADIWQDHAADIAALARGEHLAGWIELDAFERELEEAEARGELPA